MNIVMTNEEIIEMTVIYMQTPQGMQAVKNPATESLKKKKLPTKPQYWIRKALKVADKSMKLYEEARIGEIDKFTHKDADEKPLISMLEYAKIKPLLTSEPPLERPDIEDFDKAMAGEFVSIKTAEAISKWSEGHVKPDGNGRLSLTDGDELQEKLTELKDIEIDFEMEQIKVDLKDWEDNPKVDYLEGAEMDILLNLIEVVQESVNKK